MINKDRLINNFIELVKIDSPSKEERDFSQYLEKELISLGLEVNFDNAGSALGIEGGNLIAKLKGQNSKVEPIFFCAHMDTVVSNKGINVIIENEVIKSDGTTILGSDDKAGIAIILEALRVLKEKNIDHGDIEVVFTICEELGLLGSRHLDFNQLQAKFGFILDSGEDVGVIINKAPTQEDFLIEFIGREAHSGVNPEGGINAIQMASDFLSWFPYGKINDNTTGNIGIIKGGTAVNVVPGKVELAGEIRSTVDKEAIVWIERLKEKTETIGLKYGGEISFQRERMFSAYNFDGTEKIVKIVKSALKAIGKEALLKQRGGGSDANNFNEKGIPAVNLAIGITHGHTNQEEITIDNLIKGAELILAIIKETGGYHD